MQTAREAAREMEWRLAERCFRGTPEQIAASLDELILALVASRQSLRVAPRRPVRGAASTEAGLDSFTARREG